MKILFSGLKSSNYDFHFHLDTAFFEALQNEEIKAADVDIKAHMERVESMMMFTFSLTGSVSVECDRCLGVMTLPISGEEHLSVRFSDNEDNEDENVIVLPEQAREIDLTQWLYEYVVVRIPLQHVHQEGGCDPSMTKYLVGDNEKTEKHTDEIDPRWAALKDLK